MARKRSPSPLSAPEKRPRLLVVLPVCCDFELDEGDDLEAVEYDLSNGEAKATVVKEGLADFDDKPIRKSLLDLIRPVAHESDPSTSTRLFDSEEKHRLSSLFAAAQKDYDDENRPFTPAMQYWLRKNYASRDELIDKAIAAYPDAVKTVLASRNAENEQTISMVARLPSEDELPFDKAWGIYDILGRSPSAWIDYTGSCHAINSLLSRSQRHKYWIFGDYKRITEARSKEGGKRCLQVYARLGLKEFRKSFHVVAKFHPINEPGIPRFHLVMLIQLMESSRMIAAHAINLSSPRLTSTDIDLVQECRDSGAPTVIGVEACNWQLPINQNVWISTVTKKDIAIVHDVVKEFRSAASSFTIRSAFQRASPKGFSLSESVFRNTIQSLYPKDSMVQQSNKGHGSHNRIRAEQGDAANAKKKWPCPAAEKYNCLQRFTSADHARRHESVHEKKKPFKCPDCGDAFRLEENMLDHRKRGHKMKKYRHLNLPK